MIGFYILCIINTKERLNKSKKFKKLREFLGVNRTINNNIFNDVIDKVDGTWARIYLKDEKVVYYGAIVLFDKKDKYDEEDIVLFFMIY